MSPNIEKKCYRHLNIVDRIKIDLMNRKGHTKQMIADEIGCSIRTIFYELKRGLCKRIIDNEERYVYDPYEAQIKYEKQLK